MSAFICSDKHIATIAAAMFSDPVTAQQAANTLKRENIRSVNYRYKERTRITKCDMKQADLSKYTGDDIARLVACLVYQSGELPPEESDLALLNLIERVLQHQGADRHKSTVWSI